MNPYLLLLSGLALAAPLLLRRREAAWGWLAAGLAGIALLAPALALPDGVPSPAASLRATTGEPWPPWEARGTGRKSMGNPVQARHRGADSGAVTPL